MESELPGSDWSIHFPMAGKRLAKNVSLTLLVDN